MKKPKRPEKNKKNKDLMIRIRTGFTFLAQTVALCISFLYFWLIKDKILQYELLAGTCIVIGVITSVVFLVLCREAVLSKNISKYLVRMRKSYLQADKRIYVYMSVRKARKQQALQLLSSIIIVVLAIC